jgi:hypothetical protein
MSNMSYCRFENTLGDLRDCYDHIDEDLTSDHEIKARKRMIELCKRIVDDYGEDEC